ncbi:hypothetical protein [Verminephrobacter eiseniae]|nr:hypothetical protein [Verminephrobacter eiseniae]
MNLSVAGNVDAIGCQRAISAILDHDASAAHTPGALILAPATGR